MSVKVFNSTEEMTMKHRRFQLQCYKSGIVDKTCLLKPDNGPCRAGIPMYYFEPSTQNCSMFFWGGCQGNGNRFDTKQECLTTCLSQPGDTKRKPKWCSLNFDYGFCFGAIKRWYYDPIWKVCKKRIYSGCGGNKNNFYNKEQCDAICNYGIGVITSQTKSLDRSRKVLIVNPFNATTKKSKTRKTTTAPTTTVILNTEETVVVTG
ncbi:BPTI/Kunitz domain-containing protein-like [Melitaea cinxia]|uniref:BPTI/Kunitz domain-containing protein-like n=1 Tax=Melitaea cinxia TaxID=113334 RepID=UPI001E26F6BA|nr:BPTI/Kunitz domain-containing protein-like [Melitaea cinxia]